jgi:hypothetical protein
MNHLPVTLDGPLPTTPRHPTSESRYVFQRQVNIINRMGLPERWIRVGEATNNTFATEVLNLIHKQETKESEPPAGKPSKAKENKVQFPVKGDRKGSK